MTPVDNHYHLWKLPITGKQLTSSNAVRSLIDVPSTLFLLVRRNMLLRQLEARPHFVTVTFGKILAMIESIRMITNSFLRKCVDRRRTLEAVFAFKDSPLYAIVCDKVGI